jgi:D-alanyl-lipoteichoic acid acyltransferase DltB (MBOAT superfamily)
MDYQRFIDFLFGYDKAAPMMFNSGVFLVLFVFFISIYALIHKNKISVTIFVIAFGLLFYYKSSGWYLWVLIFTTFADYSFAIIISNAKKQIHKRIYLIISLCISFGLLFHFKYTNFLLSNFHNIVGNNFQPLDIFLPIGVSFYTFQSVSYILEIYWGRLKPTRNILDYAFFITFFPQLVAGPIVKANYFLPQVAKPINIKKEDIYAGLWMIMIGMFKKSVIADYISQYNDLVFANPNQYSGFENLMAVYGYTLQIYCDFSGYSDMAIGLAMIMGFDLGINFNFPYQAKNITDFWRRWHISLSSWLREYLYIPLGGNKKGKVRTYINLFLTMFLGGLWHGASWKFVFWGAWHGIGLAIHKATKKVLDKVPNSLPTNAISWFVTFHFVIFLWIFFRANDINHEVYKHVEDVEINKRTEAKINHLDGKSSFEISIFRNDSLVNTIKQPLAVTGNNLMVKKGISSGTETIIVNQVEDAFHVAWSIVGNITTKMDFTYAYPFIKVRYLWVILLVTGFLMHSTPKKWNDVIQQSYIKSHFFIKLLIFLIMVQLVIQFKSADVQPFIYFQF